jgi:hypothetical protein
VQNVELPIVKAGGTQLPLGFKDLISVVSFHGIAVKVLATGLLTCVHFSSPKWKAKSNTNTFNKSFENAAEFK